MIKLQDFAKQRGVTDRQVQRLVKKYASDIAGEVSWQGHNGTWLSDAACDFLISKMRKQPVSAVLVDDAQSERIKQLEEQLRQKEQYITALELSSINRQQLIDDLQRANFLLEADKTDLRDKVADLQNSLLCAENDKKQAIIELQQEQLRSIPFREYWSRRKNSK